MFIFCLSDCCSCWMLKIRGPALQVLAQSEDATESAGGLCMNQWYKGWAVLSPWQPFIGVPPTASCESWPSDLILHYFSAVVEMKCSVREVFLDLTMWCFSQLLILSSLSNENALQSFNLERASQGRGIFMRSRAICNENSGFNSIILMEEYLFYPLQLHVSHGLSIMIIYSYHFGCSEQQCLGLVGFSTLGEKWSLKECSLPSRHVLTALILHLPNCLCWLLSHLETSGTKSNWSN